jgi:choline dehydrogenase-like flavoprotein
VEAGPDHPDTSTLPADILDASQPTVEHDWGYSADEELDRGIAVPRARFMGGCSATNACFAQRGAPQDYDGWATLGNPGWAFVDVLEDFRRLESDTDFANQWHGSDGPIPVRRHPRTELNAVQTAFLDGATAVGHPYIEDHNQPGVVGVGPSPRTARGRTRMSTAITYLSEARGRPNLTIRPDTVVTSVDHMGTRATGIRLLDGTLVEGDRVVLAAGTYGSPAILTRSGIGPIDELERLGIRPVLNLPGVGANLSDHALLSIDLPTRPSESPSRFGSTRRCAPRLPNSMGQLTSCCSPPVRSTPILSRSQVAQSSESWSGSWHLGHGDGCASFRSTPTLPREFTSDTSPMPRTSRQYSTASTRRDGLLLAMPSSPFPPIPSFPRTAGGIG